MIITKSGSFISAAALVLGTTAQAEIPEARAQALSRCFFVYASLYEVGDKTGDTKLRSYALQRLIYVRGVLESSKTDPVFKRVFEQNLLDNKAAGLKIEEGLLQARRSGDTTKYNSEISKGSACDNELGL